MSKPNTIHIIGFDVKQWNIIYPAVVSVIGNSVYETGVYETGVYQ